MPATPATPVTPGTTNTQGLASWAAPYITDYLSKTQALAKEPYQAYEGPLTAGPSALQTQAFQGIAGLTVPSSLTQAGGMASNFAQQAGASTYNPAAAVNYNPVTASTVSSTFQAPKDYQAGTFSGGTFDTQKAQQYMNPYLQAALDPQMKEMQRQADIARLADAARLSKAGAFGGSRQAIMESEGRRNLLDLQSQALGQGYASAFDKAQQAFIQDEARRMEAERMGEQSRQFGAQQGLAGATTAGEQALRAALANQQAGLASQQSNIDAALRAAQQQEQSRQFGAGFGLDALRTGIQGAQAAGQLGEAANKASLANLQQQLAGGEIQRGITSEGIKADFDEFMRQKDDPYKKLQFQREMISGLPVGSVTSSPAQLSGIASLIGAVGGVDQLLKNTGQSNLMDLLKNLGLGGS
jgi:hypothetical protein